jgi:hypothetical protein
MGWRVELFQGLVQDLNGLSASGQLTRTSVLLIYAALRVVLPQRARHYQQRRYNADPDYFCYPVGLADQGTWHKLGSSQDRGWTWWPNGHFAHQS